MKYSSHYSNKTFIKYGELASAAEVMARQKGLREFGIHAVGETWIGGYGITTLWEGPELDEETQNLLCLKTIITPLEITK